MTATPKPDRFVSGTLTGGRLVLVRRSGSSARCGVLMFTGATLTDNADGTFDFDPSGGS
jgi:hypothetical protein